MLRGGSFDNQPRNLRSADRNRNQPENRNENIGFRCVRGSVRQHGLRNQPVLAMQSRWGAPRSFPGPPVPVGHCAERPGGPPIRHCPDAFYPSRRLRASEFTRGAVARLSGGAQRQTARTRDG
ncbi:MAG: hypothetical protein N838_02025 [Thiohalocapsa sp. PB-PSB1]|nr:MAG: hypothetical protein N838_02025 [Thiohalocapsa sp. PB-PSB1]HCS92805.1 hypothetical protein [Chromatiaceae bacterium]